MGRTQHYDLTTITSSGDDKFSDNGYKYTGSDRDRIDTELFRNARHRHVGDSTSIDAPTLAPELTLSATGGSLQANLRVYYKYTYVDEFGSESTSSPEAYVDTPVAVTNPTTPTLSTTTTGGSLLPGAYFYVLSAYTDVNTNETLAVNNNLITVPAGTSTNKNTITFPTVPTGADGWNIYRKSPGSTQYYYLDSALAAATTYDDDGSVAENCARTVPLSNTTNSTNSITIDYPGATPVIPDGYTWKLYRTFTLNNYTRSLLVHIVEESSPGVIETQYLDEGISTTDGIPPTTAPTLYSPDPIDLEDGVEIQGRLPLGNVTAFPFVVTFVFQGALETVSGEVPWTCPFPEAVIVRANARLAPGSTPASQAVIADIKKHNYNAATPSTYSIWSGNSLRPNISVAEEYDVSAAPDIDSTLLEGDYLLCDILQTGGGATPTDENLVVEVLLLAQFDIATSTFDTDGWS